MIANFLTSLIRSGSPGSTCVYSQEGALWGLTLIRGDYKWLLPSWMVLSCLIASLCVPVEKDVWFGKRDLDNDSTGDVLFVNTNILDLLPTFDPNSKEWQVI